MGLVAELKRRNVFKAAVAYLALGWVVTQVTATVAPMLHLPEWIGPVVLWIGIVGFPFLLVFSWVYEITPEGIKRESEVDRDASMTHVTSRRLDYAIIALLVLAIGLFAFDRLSPRKAAPAGDAASSATVPAAASPKSSSPSIAVLPFVDMSQAKDQEYFSDGISEELLNLLAKIPALQVAARTSSFSFKGKEVAIPEIAKTLNVAHVLEGSVRKAGDQIRITAQLIRAADGFHLWSHTYDRKLDDIFAIQDEIAADVVKQLEATLLGATPKVRKTDPKAYAMFLEAVQLSRENSREAYTRSDALLKQALELDPNYAPAWNQLSHNSQGKNAIDMVSRDEALRVGRTAAEKALAIDPGYAPAMARLGSIALAENDLPAAAAQMERAFAAAPEEAVIVSSVGTLLRVLGRRDEALAFAAASVARDPLNPQALTTLAANLRLAGRFDEAIEHLRTVLRLTPRRVQVRYDLAMALLSKGEAQAALAELEDEDPSWGEVGLPIVYHALGRKAESDAALAALIEHQKNEAAIQIAYAYAYRGEADRAFEWLDRAIAQRDSGLWIVTYEPCFDNIRSDPRWLPTLRRVGLDPESLAKVEFKVKPPA